MNRKPPLMDGYMWFAWICALVGMAIVSAAMKWGTM